MSSKSKYRIYENILIADAAGEGRALARIDERVVFVDHGVPGDVADIQVYKKKKSYWFARVVKLHTPSGKRTTPFCSHFGTCGGCSWQHMQYNQQLHYKQKQVVDNLARIGKTALPDVQPILPAPDTIHYRNKLEFTFSNHRWFQQAEEGLENKSADALGFHVPGRFDRVLDVTTCYLQPEPSNRIRNAVKAYAEKNVLSFYDVRRHTGFLRNLIIRNTAAGEVMVILVFASEDKVIQENMLRYIADSFPEVVSLLYVVNTKKNDVISDLGIFTFRGKDFIVEEMDGLRFKIGAKSFFQTNTRQALALYRTIKECAGFTGKETVYDLYTGTGTIANFIASAVKRVVGIEYIPSAIEDARENARLNHITNTAFYAGDIKDTLTGDFIRVNGSPDIIITDPPRSGMHPDVVKTILTMAPQKVVYVSCNAATQARDIEMMKDMYAIKFVQPVDMFPHTHHVENVLLLEKMR